MTENELKDLESILVDIEKLVNKVENELKAMLENAVKNNDLSENSIDQINVLNAKLEVLKQSGDSLFYKKQRVMKGLGYVPDEGCEDEESNTLFFKTLSNETKIRNVQFMYV